MSIRRPRGPKPILKHLAFLEALSEYTAPSASYRAVLAGLLTLRLFDQWRSLGPIVADGRAPIVRATRGAVGAVEDSDLQFLLTRIVDGMLMLRESDANAVQLRLAALADHYAQRGALALEADVRQMIGPSASASSIPVTTLTGASV